MPIHERRQHLRIDDHIYFEYCIIDGKDSYSDQNIEKQLLGENGLRYIEACQYFQDIDQELAELTEKLGLKEPALAHYLNLMNAKMDFISRHLFMGQKTNLRKVNISLGGMSFKSTKKINEHSRIKLVIYTKPKMLPVIVDAVVVYCQYQNENHYRTAVEFSTLNNEQEQLLSQHIMQIQIRTRAD